VWTGGGEAQEESKVDGFRVVKSSFAAQSGSKSKIGNIQSGRNQRKEQEGKRQGEVPIFSRPIGACLRVPCVPLSLLIYPGSDFHLC